MYILLSSASSKREKAAGSLFNSHVLVPFRCRFGGGALRQHLLKQNGIFSGPEIPLAPHPPQDPDMDAGAERIVDEVGSSVSKT